MRRKFLQARRTLCAPHAASQITTLSKISALIDVRHVPKFVHQLIPQAQHQSDNEYKLENLFVIQFTDAIEPIADRHVSPGTIVLRTVLLT